MLMLHQSQPFFRFIALVTILTFFPSSIAVWNFIPPRWDVAEAEETAATPAGPDSVAVDTPSAEVLPGLPPKILTQEELAAISGGPARGAAAQAAAPRRNHLPEAKIARTLPKSTGPASAESSPAQAEPIQLAQAQPAGVDAALAAADAQWDAGNLADAYLGYVGVLNDYPQALLPAVIDARDRIKDMAKTLDEAGFQALNAVAADWTTLHGPLAVRGTNEFYRAWADACKERDDLDGWVWRTQEVMARSMWGILKYPNNLDTRRLFSWYLTAANDLDMRREGERELQEFLLKQEPSVITFEGWARLANNAAQHQDAGQRIIYAANALGSADTLGAVLNNPAELQKEKAELAYRLGEMYEDVGMLDEALAQFQDMQTRYPVPEALARNGNAVYDAGIRAAQMIARQNANDLYQGVLAYNDFIQRYPNGPLVGQARFEMAGLYILAGDYRQGAQMYQQLVQDNPGQAEQVWRELDFILTYLYDSVEVASGEPVAAAEDVKIAQMCGPSALQKLLKTNGVDVAKEELATLAGTDETGTTMLGLVEAAKAKGIELAGVEAPEAEGLPQPFIAYVNHNHFLVVREVRPDAVVVLDMDKPEAALTRAEFARMWDGKALIRAEASSQVAQVLNPEAQKGAKGGCESSPPPPPPPTCDTTTTDCDTCPKPPKCASCGAEGGEGGKGICPMDTGCTSQPSETPKTNPGPEGKCHDTGGGEKIEGACNKNSTPGTMGSPTSITGVSSPGVHPIINTLQTGLVLNESDTSLDVEGALTLVFQRAYYNPFGYHRTEFQGTAKPWMNNIGDGWTHNLNMHLRVAYGTTPATAVFYDATGEARTYTYSSTAGNYNYYVPASTSFSSEKGDSLRRHTGTKVWTLDKSNGLTYEFSAATTDAYLFARLEAIKDTTGNTMTLSYNGAVGTGKLTKVTSPDGDAQHLALSYSGNLITKVELKRDTDPPVLQTTTFAYNASNELTKVTDNASQDVSYAYASDANAATSRMITKITDKGGRETTLDWTFSLDNGTYKANAIDFTNVEGLTTTYDRSVATSICTITNWDGVTMLSKFVNTPMTGDTGRSRYKDYYLDASNYERWSHEYDSGGNLTKTLRPGNVVDATYAYNAKGKMITKAGNDGVATTWYYGADGLYATKMTDKAGLDTLYYYDNYQRLATTVTPWSGSAGIVVGYDTNGKATSVTDPLGHVTTYGYDSLGRMTSVKDPLNNETKMDYDGPGNVTKVTDPRNKYTYYYYAYVSCGGCGGKSGQLTKVKDHLDNETLLTYDAHGNATKVTDALSRETDYFYDDMDRLTQVESPSGSGVYMTVAYDLLGRRSSQTDFEGKTKNFYYDHVGRQTRVTDPVGTYVEYSFDSAGNLSTVEDGNGYTTANDYDGGGRLTKVTYPNGKVTRYFYDAADRMTKVGAGSTGTLDPTEYFFHGTTGLMTKVRYTAGGNTVDAVYAYDTAAGLTKLTDWIDDSDGLRYAYDDAGRLTTLTDYDDSTLEFMYDAAGNVLTMEDYHGSVVTYTYTDTDQVSTITAPGSKVWTYSYNALGQPTSMSIPNGMTTGYGYDLRNRLTAIEHEDGANVLDGFYYALDVGGNITRTTYQDDQYWDYWYDGRDRLTKAERRDDNDTLLHRYTYTYDVGDNMTTKEVYDGTDTDTYVYAYTAANELTKQTVSGTDTTYGYDAWGRMTSKSDGTYSASYFYNYGDELTKATSTFPTEGTVEYDYGADQKRRERDDGTTVTWYNYDIGWNLLNEESNAGTLTITYVHDPMKSIGTVLADLAGTTPATGTTRYYAQDNIGSTRRLRDESEGSLGQYEFGPYGGTYSQSGASTMKLFTGHDWDETVNLYCAPYRYYDPVFAKWLTRDPLGMIVGPNMYTYVRNNPINDADPLGLVPCLWWVVSGPCGVGGWIKCTARCKATYGTACIKCTMYRCGHPTGWSFSGCKISIHFKQKAIYKCGIVKIPRS